MGGQGHAERLQVLRHSSKATINQCGQFGEEQTREGQFGGIEPQKKSGGRND
jgi:hypothetical protein